MLDRPATRPFIRQQDDPSIPPGPLVYGVLTALSALWKTDDNLPFRRPESFRISQFSPINIITRLTPTQPTISLTPDIAIWALYDLIKATVAVQRWRAAVYDIQDIRTGIMFATISIFDERHPPPASQSTLGEAKNNTTSPSTLVNDGVLTASERLVIRSHVLSSIVLTRHQVFDLFVRASLWILAHRASAPVYRVYGTGDGTTIGVGDLAVTFQMSNLGDRRKGWLTWEQVGDAWRGMINLAMRNGEQAGYTAMEAAFMRNADSKVMVAVRYQLSRGISSA